MTDEEPDELLDEAVDLAGCRAGLLLCLASIVVVLLVCVGCGWEVLR